MDDPLLEIHKLLKDFENELSKIREVWKQLEIDNPDFEQVSEENWQEKQARMWLHFATNAWECNELERWLYSDLPATKIAQSPALGIYKAWRKWLKTAGIPKFVLIPVYDKKTRSYREMESKEPSNAYYAEDDRFDIEKPSKDEKLLDFIVRLACIIEDDGKGHRLEWRALKSFLDFSRRTYPKEQVAFIEQIFPQKMNLHYG